MLTVPTSHQPHADSDWAQVREGCVEVIELPEGDSGRTLYQGVTIQNPALLDNIDRPEIIWHEAIYALEAWHKGCQREAPQCLLPLLQRCRQIMKIHGTEVMTRLTLLILRQLDDWDMRLWLHVGADMARLLKYDPVDPRYGTPGLLEWLDNPAQTR